MLGVRATALSQAVASARVQAHQYLGLKPSGSSL